MELQLLQLSWFEIMVFGVAFFATLYFGFGLLNDLLVRIVLPFFGLGRLISAQPIAPAQFRRELGYSLSSILIFGIGLVVPWYLHQKAWLQLAQSAGVWQILAEIVVLIIWNEIHFYISHRLLHTPLLRRFHLLHHKSIRTSAWSTYSFHPIEALMLGSVILLPAVCHDFSFAALVFIPVWSIFLNNLGHSNYASVHPAWFHFLSRSSERHALHHTHYHGNYGFFMPWLDRWCRTEIVLPI